MACESCDGLRFILSQVYGSQSLPDGTYTIERCDDCSPTVDDEIAAFLAYYLAKAAVEFLNPEIITEVSNAALTEAFQLKGRS